jgi:predicted aldo/keto reductase-like oxidoreductase
VSKRESRAGNIDRREFLLAGAAGVVGLWGADAASAEAVEPRVRRYVPLGKTGMSISDISFGSSRMRDPVAVRHAFERGINYFDSAEGYKGGDSETAIGEALHDVRDRVFLTSKTKAGADATRGEMMKALEGSLERLRTDHVDVYFNHAVNEVERMQNDEWAEFTEAAKKQGKIRFRGMSGHGAHLVECLNYALDHKLVDVILAAYNFGQDPAFVSRFLNRFDFITLQPGLPPVLERAHREGVGVVAMKTLMGARANDMRPYEREGSTFSQAAFRWTLSNPDVDALVISMNDPKSIDEYLGASGTGGVSRRDLGLLGTYATLNGAGYCQHGCDACASSCPSGVEISEVLRTRMYDVDYGDRELARADYAAIAGNGSACLGCTGSPCAIACPNGIPIPEFTRSAAQRLG